MTLLATSAGDVLDYALAAFLVVVRLGAPLRCFIRLGRDVRAALVVHQAAPSATCCR